MIRAAIIISVALGGMMIGAAQAQQKLVSKLDGWKVQLDQPTNRYGHGIMGNVPEWGRMCLSGPNRQKSCVVLPQNKVFEEMSPRLADVDLDGTPDVILVESDNRLGAALAIYLLRDDKLFRVATPNIGRANRWLAPIGVADMDGDGAVELAYIDRPHLAKNLCVWRFENDRLSEVANLKGLTNHRIGQEFISGGLRDCGQGAEMITSDAAWQNIMATQLRNDRLQTRSIARFSKTKDFDAVLACKN